MKYPLPNESPSIINSLDSIATRTDLRLIALDFDLTIYDHANPLHTLELQKWMLRMAEHGIAVGLASGRPVADLRTPLDEIGWKWADPFPSFVVGYEGEIYRPDGRPWPGTESYNTKRRQAIEDANTWLEERFETLLVWAEGAHLELMHPISTSPGGTHVVFQTPEMAEIARRKLVVMLNDQPDIAVLRNHHILLALPKSAGKGAALEELARLHDYQTSQVLCIGDNLNDWSMLCENRGFNIATVANADNQILEQVTQRGGYVSPHAISRGVADIFDQYLK